MPSLQIATLQEHLSAENIIESHSQPVVLYASRVPCKINFVLHDNRGQCLFQIDMGFQNKPSTQESTMSEQKHYTVNYNKE